MPDVVVFLLFVPVCPAETVKIARKELEVILLYALSGYYLIAEPVSRKEPAWALFWDIVCVQKKKAKNLLSINSQSDAWDIQSSMQLLQRMKWSNSVQLQFLFLDLSYVFANHFDECSVERAGQGEEKGQDWQVWLVWLDCREGGAGAQKHHWWDLWELQD